MDEEGQVMDLSDRLRVRADMRPNTEVQPCREAASA